MVQARGLHSGSTLDNMQFKPLQVYPSVNCAVVSRLWSTIRTYQQQSLVRA